MFAWLQHQRALRHAKSAPRALQDYLARYAERPRAGQDWRDLRFVVFDTETTGLDARKDHILTLGAIVVQDGAIHLAQSLELRLLADPQADAGTIAVHGILPAESRLGQDQERALLEFLTFLGPDVLVAHHVAFDAGIITHSLRRRYPGFHLYNPRVDTAVLAQRAEFPDKRPHELKAADFTLDVLCQRHDIRMTDRHTAWGDAYLTAILLLKLLHRMEDQQQFSLRRLME